MNNSLVSSVLGGRLVARSGKAALGQALFVVTALLMPTVTHRLGLDYSLAQPMHWMILFAGLTYGAFAGSLVGLAVPVLSFMISGMPLPPMLALMIPELMVYGFVAGAFKKRLTGFGSVTIALVAGRAVYLALALLLGRVGTGVGAFVVATWAPGIPAMIVQIVLLPILAGLYISSVKD